MIRKFLGICAIICLVVLCSVSCGRNNDSHDTAAATDTLWHAPDTSLITKQANADLIRYGRKLIANTAYYLGPEGTVNKLSNGMNCQNCHLNAGTQTFGNNFGMVASTYPNFRPRSGKIESIYQRINECMRRSMNGKQLDTTSKEMLALAAYIYWVGKDVKKGTHPQGAGAGQLAYMSRAADTVNGKNIYRQKCALCHAGNGSGMPNINGGGFQYPPIWGEHSYNNGASMFRLGKLATYIKNNMPFGVTYQSPQLTDEEAWDIAAFINSQKRPEMDLSGDWPDLVNKPIDYPYGPYKDGFGETQHKYGPFKPMVEEGKKNTNAKS